MHARTDTLRHLIGSLILGVAGALLFTPLAQAAEPTAAQTQYQRDVAHCNDSSAVTDREACLREAGAAAQAASQGTLTAPDAQAEALAQTNRCDALSGDQREDCMRLMRSPDTRTQGSVSSGGILRELTITTPAPVVNP